MRKKTKLRGTPSSAAASKGCFGNERRPSQQQDHHEGRVDPDVHEHDREERRARVRRPFEIGDAGEAHEIAEDTEVRVRHQLPHERGQGGRRHQRQQQQDRGGVVETRRLLQQQCDAEAEHQFEADRETGIDEGNGDRVPERGVAEERDVVVEPDEALQHRQVQPEAHHRVVGGGEERDEDADADQQRRQAQHIGERPPHDPRPDGSCNRGVSRTAHRSQTPGGVSL
jgi:hypothetical protein